MLLLACRLGQVLQNVLHFEVATGDPHPFGNPEPKGVFPFGYHAILSQMVLTQNSCVLLGPTIFYIW